MQTDRDPNKASVDIRRAIPAEHVAGAAHCVWQVFRSKLRIMLSDTERAEAFLTQAMNPQNAFCALGPDNELLGVAGLKWVGGTYFADSLTNVQRTYGWFGGLWRGLLLGIFDHECRPGVLHLDCLFVAGEARGLGVGTALLDAVAAEAKRRGLRAVSLEVVSTNPDARRLYERAGYVATKTTRLWPFHRLFGFDAVTEMELAL